MDMFELTGRLNAAHGPSGDEEGIRTLIADLARPYADEITADTMGILSSTRRATVPA